MSQTVFPPGQFVHISCQLAESSLERICAFVLPAITIDNQVQRTAFSLESIGEESK